MQIVSQVLIGCIAFIHLYIFIFEAFLWEKRGPKVFRNFSKDLFFRTKPLAFNQGVYNIFLCAGLVWSLFIKNDEWSQNIALFFLVCVSIAGIVGAVTVEKKILLVQTVPSVITIGLLLIS